MTESSFFSKPNLPPKRKPPLNSDSNVEDQNNDVQDNFSDEQSEISPEELLALENMLKDTEREINIDLEISSSDKGITAPILEEYIDPLSVPINYLLKQAGASVSREEIIQQMLDEQDQEEQK